MPPSPNIFLKDFFLVGVRGSDVRDEDLTGVEYPVPAAACATFPVPVATCAPVLVEPVPFDPPKIKSIVDIIREMRIRITC